MEVGHAEQGGDGGYIIRIHYICKKSPENKQLNREFRLLGSALSRLQIDFSKGNVPQIMLAKRPCQHAILEEQRA